MGTEKLLQHSSYESPTFLAPARLDSRTTPSASFQAWEREDLDLKRTTFLDLLENQTIVYYCYKDTLSISDFRSVS